MQIAILGANGRLGRAVTLAAVAAGHAVVAVVRRPGIVEEGASVRVRCVDLHDPGALAAALQGCEAAVFTIGTPPWRRQVVSAGIMAVLIDGMQQVGVSRLVAVSAFGIGDSIDHLPAPARWLLRLARPYALDKAEVERRVRASDVRWTLVRPWVMRSSAARLDVRAAFAPPRPVTATYADVAAVIVAALADPTAIGQAIYLARR